MLCDRDTVSHGARVTLALPRGRLSLVKTLCLLMALPALANQRDLFLWCLTQLSSIDDLQPHLEVRLAMLPLALPYRSMASDARKFTRVQGRKSNRLRVDWSDGVSERVERSCCVCFAISSRFVHHSYSGVASTSQSRSLARSHALRLGDCISPSHASDATWSQM